jgi:hypothetical protein
LIGWIISWWNARNRAFDLKILWPTCKEQAEGDLTLAKAAFALHAFHDPAWTCLGEAEIVRQIDELT